MPRPLAAAAALALLTGLWSGLVRLGWALPPLRAALPALHGPLMVPGFLGTLVGLERAVALGGRWPQAPPLVNALGTLAIIGGLPGRGGQMLVTLGGLGLVAVFAAIARRQFAPFTVLPALGAAALAVGNALWLGGARLSAAATWWATALVLMISGERLELGRLTRPSRRSQAVLWSAVALCLLGSVGATVDAGASARPIGLGFLLLAGWWLRYDIARYAIRQPGAPRYGAVGLLSGFAWLGVSGILWMWHAREASGPLYDARLHAVFVGFALAMVFAHAPIILPAVLGRSLPVRPRFYAHLGLLHVSLLVRVTGDLVGWTAARHWGGLLNAIAVLLFLTNLVVAVREGARGGGRDGRPVPEGHGGGRAGRAGADGPRSDHREGHPAH
jgi:hypothetical protein